MDFQRVITPEEQILLILGHANQVKYVTLFENIERCDIWVIESDDIESLINNLLEFTEHMEKNGEGDDAIIPLTKCFELSKRLDVTSRAQKMLVLARLTNKLDASSTNYYRHNVLPDMRRQINKAKTALYTTLVF